MTAENQITITLSESQLIILRDALMRVQSHALTDLQADEYKALLEFIDENKESN